MNHYLVSLFWSAKDDAFIAELPELPGCMADGATKQAALKKAEQVIKEWIATAKSLGRPIPEPKGRLAYA
jgi:predicted RNase H-like HicB family nuclease